MISSAITTLIIHACLLSFSVSCLYEVDVDFSSNLGILNHFWESTGFCPPEPLKDAHNFLLSPDVEMNLVLIGGLPANGRFQVRVHWLLNLISVQYGYDGPKYNFTLLDEFMNRIRKYGLKPGFEIMGNPSQYFNDFENETQVMQWRDLVNIIAKRYIDKYGLQYVQQWNFESWNEPDHKDFDGLNITIPGFLNYYDACAEGLTLAHESLRIGGPAESFRGKFVNYSWALLEHCAHGRNYFSNQIGTKLDFISMHKKGDNSSLHILNEELKTISEIHNRLPEFKSVPIYNDEADPLTGWWRQKKWRADCTYAAMAVKVIGQHINLDPQSANTMKCYELLSNDNAFLNYYPSFFEQRTLMARFQMNNTHPPHVQMIKKPIYTATGLLWFLGEKRLTVAISVNGNPIPFDGNFGAVAASHEPNLNDGRDSWNAGIVYYNSADTNDTDVKRAVLNISLHSLSSFESPWLLEDVKYVWYIMDNKLSNPYLAWVHQGQPVFPVKAQFREMRSLEGPSISYPKSLPASLHFKKKLSLPGIMVLHVCAKPKLPPNMVTVVHVWNVTTADIIILWNGKDIGTRCVKTFVVEFRHYNSPGPYIRINEKPVIFNTFQYTVIKNGTESADDREVWGLYRVRAVDYWNRRSPPSLPFLYGPLQSQQ